MELAKAGLRHTKTIRGQFRRSITIDCDNTCVTFDTTTEAAKEWFYPRYYDGSLHEPALTRRLLQELDSDSTFYDVGAHVGYFTAFGATKCTDGDVHTFEIEPRFVEAIKRTVDRNEFSVEIVQAAVSNKSGDTLSYTSSGSSTKVSDDGEPTAAESITLDDYAERHSPPDVMKVDVEGYEYNVLQGAEGLLKNGHPDVLFLEIHPENLQEYGVEPKDIATLLERHGYDWVNFDHRVDDSKVQRNMMEDLSTNTMYMIWNNMLC
ncbi:FkbM family methyltransferase [Halorientalis marina]|uniref:FkbM family methyltransferase n=1 Tax=Halorientalis marina TaxID=2931976 RepID=UPI001FF23334|nr:FkbM family methyltransferase [Halorientalis marina]